MAARPGSPVEVRNFAHARPIEEHKPGWVSLPLDLFVLSGRDSLQDVRVIDRSNRQIPYVIDQRGSIKALLPLARQHSEQPQGATRYAARLPWGGTPPGQLRLSAEENIFQRSIVISAEPNSDRLPRELAREVWSSRGPASSNPFVIELPALAAQSIEVEVNDGDNAALRLEPLTITTPATTLHFYHPGGQGLRLLYGNSQIAEPHYDLALRSVDVLRTPSTIVDIGKEISRRSAALPRDRLLLTVAIAAVAAILLFIFGRLLRNP